MACKQLVNDLTEIWWFVDGVYNTNKDMISGSFPWLEVSAIRTRWGFWIRMKQDAVRSFVGSWGLSWSSTDGEVFDFQLRPEQATGRKRLLPFGAQEGRWSEGLRWSWASASASAFASLDCRCWVGSKFGHASWSYCRHRASMSFLYCDIHYPFEEIVAWLAYFWIWSRCWKL